MSTAHPNPDRTILYRGFSDNLLSLRGIAAVSVLIFHAMLIFPIDGRDNIIHHAPTVHLGKAQYLGQLIVWLTNGSGAVTFFFVHSGFVLSLSLSRYRPHPHLLGRLVNYTAYMIKRVCRLFPMIVVAAALGFVYQTKFMYHPAPSQVSQWFLGFFAEPTSFRNLLDNCLLLDGNLNKFFWTLRIEMGASLLMPLFVIASRRASTGFLVLFLFYLFASPGSPYNTLKAGLMICFFMGTLLGTFTDEMTAFAREATLACATCSAAYVGSFLARPVNALCRALTNPNFYVLAGFLVLSMARAFISTEAIAFMVETLAALPIIYVVYYVDEGPLQWFCTLRFVRFLGRISYSLYILSALLIHGIGSVMLLTIPASFITAHGLLMNVMAAAVLFSLACLLGRLTFHFIEQPFMAYGHRVNAIVHSKVDQI